MKSMLRILGVDPGSRITGYAFIETPVYPVVRLQQCRILDAGVIRTQIDQSFERRIGDLHDALYSLVQEYNPEYGVFEDGFCHKNFRSALKLAQARGALTTALTRSKTSVFEVSATEVKKAIAGNGHARKEQVAQALELCMQFKKGKQPFDVTDALAIAVTFAMTPRPQKGEPHVKKTRNRRSMQPIAYPM